MLLNITIVTWYKHYWIMEQLSIKSAHSELIILKLHFSKQDGGSYLHYFVEQRKSKEIQRLLSQGVNGDLPDKVLVVVQYII